MVIRSKLTLQNPVIICNVSKISHLSLPYPHKLLTPYPIQKKRTCNTGNKTTLAAQYPAGKTSGRTCHLTCREAKPNAGVSRSSVLPSHFPHLEHEDGDQVRNDHQARLRVAKTYKVWVLALAYECTGRLRITDSCSHVTTPYQDEGEVRQLCPTVDLRPAA